jgi:hypothetical protein
MKTSSPSQQHALSNSSTSKNLQIFAGENRPVEDTIALLTVINENMKTTMNTTNLATSIKNKLHSYIFARRRMPG